MWTKADPILVGLLSLVSLLALLRKSSHFITEYGENMNGSNLSQIRVLVTGAGGPAAIAVIRSLGILRKFSLVAGDMDPWAAGLYMVLPENRVLLLPADHPNFIENLLATCKTKEISILISTVDGELEPVALNIAGFNAVGTKVMGAPLHILLETLDKFALARKCLLVVGIPRTELLDSADFSNWTFPVVIKPRWGSGSKGVRLVNQPDDITHLDLENEMLIQEYLPGDEYSIDVLATCVGVPVAAVPRLRVKVDSGIAVAGRSLCDTELEEFGMQVVATLGLPFISNVQAKRRATGELCLLEVNPRVPGSIALTKASGVDMVRLAVDELLGIAIPVGITHREVAMVRPLADLVIECADLVEGALPSDWNQHPPVKPLALGA